MDLGTFLSQLHCDLGKLPDIHIITAKPEAGFYISMIDDHHYRKLHTYVNPSTIFHSYQAFISFGTPLDSNAVELHRLISTIKNGVVIVYPNQEMEHIPFNEDDFDWSHVYERFSFYLRVTQGLI